MKAARITVFAGHYGSGKTNLAINYALWLGASGRDTVICDLDIVNPYFRTADSAGMLERCGIKLITSQFANTNVDAPAIPPAARAVFDNKGVCAVIDLGGDDRGALALGRYAESIVEEDDYEMLLVVNRYRPLSDDAEKLIEIKREIEQAAGVTFTGIVNNSNLGGETTTQDVAGSMGFALELSKELKLPIKMTSVSRNALRAAEDAAVLLKDTYVFPIDIYEKTIWKI